MSSATPRRHLSKDDKLAIIEASKSPGFNDFTMNKGFIQYDL